MTTAKQNSFLSTLQLSDKSAGVNVKNGFAGSSLPRAELTNDVSRSSKIMMQEGGGASATGQLSDEEQLSNDLRVFLENPSLKQALADGSLDLAAYGGQVEDELAVLERECIALYRSKATDIRTLQKELQDCDGVLALLEELLLGFQADLGGLSGDIRNLQETSKELNHQLSNRQHACFGLRQFLEHVVVSPQLSSTITDGKINTPAFVAAVQELQQLVRDVHETKPQTWSCDVPPAETVAGKEMQEHVSQLRLLAVQRIRDYFLQNQIQRFKQANTNIRMIQAHGLIPYAALYDFLQATSPSSADEIFNAYCDRMSKTMYALFRTYHAQLVPLDSTRLSATRQDVIAIDDAVLRDALTTKAKQRVDVFSLKTRATDVLNAMKMAPSAGASSASAAASSARRTASSPSKRQSQTGSKRGTAASSSNAASHGDGTTSSQTTSAPPIISAHVAARSGQMFPYERIFQSILSHFVNAVTNEFVVCRQMFKRDAFDMIFRSTTQLILEQLENYLFTCHDALCILLMIKVSHSMKRLAHHRTIYSMDAFLESITQLLWPRLQVIIATHRRSLQQATSVSLGGIDLHGHYVSRRFAELTCSILLILQEKDSMHIANATGAGSASTKRESIKSKKASPKKNPESRNHAARSKETEVALGAGVPVAASGSATASNSSAGDMLLRDVNDLVDDFVALMKRLAEETHTSNKTKSIFLINNLDSVVCIFRERRVVGKELNRILDELLRQREMFVEEELLCHGFSKMIAFLQQTEAHLVAAASNKDIKHDMVNVQVVEALVRDFSSNWKQRLEDMNRNVLSFFSNFRNGMEILKQVLTQLLLYYTRFQDVLRKVFAARGQAMPTFCKDLVPTATILAEIKKYALSI
mmetsp:Transcript_12398/g.36017  ORF Transcript_12398/g.36017 Transcript_12398/m.36017 type:complete len:874 (-) Transcript_12398:60-2681(-)